MTEQTRPRRFIPYHKLEPDYGISFTRQHLDRLVKGGQFPKKIRLTAARVGWWADEIESWLASKDQAA